MDLGRSDSSLPDISTPPRQDRPGGSVILGGRHRIVPMDRATYRNKGFSYFPKPEEETGDDKELRSTDISEASWSGAEGRSVERSLSVARRPSIILKGIQVLPSLRSASLHSAKRFPLFAALRSASGRRVSFASLPDREDPKEIIRCLQLAGSRSPQPRDARLPRAASDSTESPEISTR